MLFRYKATTPAGVISEGEVDTGTLEAATVAIQRRGLIVLEIKLAEEAKWWQASFFERVKQKDVVVLSRQLSTLFEAKLPVLDSFRLLSRESYSPKLQKALSLVADDIQSGLPISKALAKQGEIFSEFYVNMIASGEESGKLSETFTYLAAYLERQHELVSKAKHAMVYPAFVITAFIGVMILMFTVVIPKLSDIIEATGGDVPFYTRVVIATSDFFVSYGLILLAVFIVAVLFVWRYSLTADGKLMLDRVRLSTPYVGDLYQKLYLSRIADNLDTLLSSGVTMLKALEVTSRVVGSVTYQTVLLDAMEVVKGGGTLSQAFSKHRVAVPAILVQMIRIGEETGRVGFVLGTLSRFYRREVEAAIETLVSLIEPAMIIMLGAGVGVLLTSVLLPIYNLAGSIA